MQEGVTQRIAKLSTEKRDLLLQQLAKQQISLPKREPQRGQRPEDTIPLSFPQQRLWFLDHMQPGEATYSIPAAFWLDGPLFVEELQASLQSLIERHEILRTTFQEDTGNAIQVIHPALESPLPVIDLSHLPEAEGEAEALKSAQQHARRPFDLQRGPLWHPCLFRLHARRHLLLVCMHHIISDGWSLNIFFDELLAFYQARVQKRACTLPPLPCQYADYALRQYEQTQGDALEQQLAFWIQHLSGAPRQLPLPTDHPRPYTPTTTGAVYSFTLAPELAHRLKQLTQQEGVTMFMLLLAAFQVVLQRYSGQQDIVVGTPIANRTQADLEGLIGLFVNTLVIRTRFSRDASFSDVLQQVRETLLDVYAHQDLPFERLVEVLQPERHPGIHPLFQVAFVYLTTSMRLRKAGALMATPFELETQTSKFDLTLEVLVEDGRIRASIEYSVALFERQTIVRLAQHLTTLLESIVNCPQTPIAHLPMLTPAENAFLLYGDNLRNVAVPRECASRLFERQATRHPERIALQDGTQWLSYQYVNAQANRLARYLRAQGVGPEVRVGLALHRCVDTMIAILSILKAGGAYVPLDPRYPVDRLSYILEDAQPALVLAQSALTDQLFSLPALCPYHYLDQVQEHLPQYADTNLDINVDIENLAYLIYTSGSTGRPKGVLVSHHGLSNVAWAQTHLLEVTDQERVLQLASLNFDASVFEWVMALLNGATLYICEQEEQRFGTGLLDYLRREQITIATLPPSVLASMPYESLTYLRTIVVAGEACSAQLVEDWGQERRFYNAYGPTEATIWSTVARCKADTHPPSIGQQISNTQIYILDEAMEAVPQGIAGELYIGGIGLARGYQGQPVLTAERFVPHPYSLEPGARLYKTGDIVRMRADGNLEFVGRIDQQVKLRGYRIELGEIELTLCRHPQIKEAVVTVYEESPGTKYLVAYVISQASERLSEQEIRRFLRTSLPEYMLPTHILEVESFPLSLSGKIDRRALPAPPLSDDSIVSDEGMLITPVEELLATHWTALLRKEKVGRSSNFFDLGGHSLLVTQLRARIQATFHIEISLRSLFEAPTLLQQAYIIEQARRDEQQAPSTAVPLKRQNRQPKDGLPLSFAQQRLWFLDQLKPGEATYNISEAYQLKGKLDRGALQRSLQQLVERHESLRTCFPIHMDHPIQVVLPAEELAIPVHDLRIHSLERYRWESR